VRLSIAVIAGALALATATPVRAEQPSRPVVVRVESGGFHWIDALIGAGGLAGLALGLSGAFALYLRRDRPADPRPAPKEET
jgi:hypothetical protein